MDDWILLQIAKWLLTHVWGQILSSGFIASLMGILAFYTAPVKDFLKRNAPFSHALLGLALIFLSLGTINYARDIFFPEEILSNTPTFIELQVENGSAKIAGYNNVQTMQIFNIGPHNKVEKYVMVALFEKPIYQPVIKQSYMNGDAKLIITESPFLKSNFMTIPFQIQGTNGRIRISLNE